jgi:VWFA-related protein
MPRHQHCRLLLPALAATVLLGIAVSAAQQAQAPPAAPAAPSPAGGRTQTAPPGAPGQPAQQPLATFRSSTRLIVQNVTVRDKEGKSIEGLTKADFAVIEDNQPQEVAFVEYQQIEGEPGSAPAEPVEPDAAAIAAAAAPAAAPVIDVGISTPPPGTVKYQDRRLIVLYFDMLSMQPPDETRAFDNARKFVDTQMAAADVVAVMTFSNGVLRVRQDFTPNRAALRELIQTLQFGDDINGDGAADNPEGTAFGQGDAEFTVFNTDRQLAALQTAVKQLGSLTEKKTLIYFGSGMRLNGSENMAQLSATTNAAIKANVTINPIDARGLTAAAPLGNANERSSGGTAMFSGAGAGSRAASEEQSKDTFFALAKDTGGKAMFDYNDLSLGIVEAARAADDYYIVAYYSTHTATDGKVRRVRISLTGGRQAVLTYQQAYYGEKTFAAFTNADKERQLEEAFMLGDPITEMTIAMELNYFQLDRANYYVPVAMKIPGSELNLARRRGAARTSMDFIAEVKDEYGITIQSIRDKIDIKLSDEDAEQLAKRPIQYENGFTLLPAKYVIKVLVRDATTGRMGTYQAPFQVPNLVKETTHVPISSVVLSSQRIALGDELFTVNQKTEAMATNPLIHDGEKLVPSVTRVFSVSKDLYVYLEAYQRGVTTQKPMVAFVTFYRGQDKAFETAPLPVIYGLDSKSKSVPMRFSVPLTEITPGRYDCQVTVLDPESQKAAFWRMPVVLVP